MSPDTPSPRDIVLSYLNAFSSGDAERVAAHVSETFVNIQTGLLGTGCTGRDTYRQRLKDFLSTFQKLTYTPEDILVDGDRVAVAYRMAAEQDGRPFTVQGVMLITLENGLIARRSDYWDGLTYLRQTGQTLA